MTFREMRDAFEQYACDEGFDLSEHVLHPLYLSGFTQFAWRTWKAAYVALGAYATEDPK